MNWDSTDASQVRRFGLIAGALFSSLCGFALWRGKIPLAIPFGVLAFLGLGLALAPGRSRPIYVAWIRVTRFLGRLFTAMLLAAVYCIVITPFGLLKRIFGSPILPMRPDKGASSYWVPRDPPCQPRERFLKRY
jgi:hypothetical protein